MTRPVTEQTDVVRMFNNCKERDTSSDEEDTKWDSWEYERIPKETGAKLIYAKK